MEQFVVMLLLDLCLGVVFDVYDLDLFCLERFFMMIWLMFLVGKICLLGLARDLNDCAFCNVSIVGALYVCLDFGFVVLF